MGDLISHVRDLSRRAHPCKRRYDWLANGQNEAGEGFAEIEDGVGHGEEPFIPNSEVAGGFILKTAVGYQFFTAESHHTSLPPSPDGAERPSLPLRPPAGTVSPSRP